MKISILVPSKSRPHRFKKFIESLVTTCKDLSNLTVYCYLDNDDPKLNEYTEFHEIVKYTIGDPISVSKSWNIIAEKAYQDGNDIFIMGNDDQVYHTKNWDEILLDNLNKLPHRYFCTWFKDGIVNGRLATFPILTKEWYELFDHRFTPGIFNHGLNDLWIFDIAKRAKVCNYIDEVFAEHQHHLVYNEYFDDVYSSKWKVRVPDKEIFDNNLAERIALAEKIKNKIS